MTVPCSRMPKAIQEAVVSLIWRIFWVVLEPIDYTLIVFKRTLVNRDNVCGA